MLTDVTAEGKYSLGVVVASLNADAGYGTEVSGDQCVESLMSQFFTDVLAEKFAVTSRTTVRTKRKIDGKRNLVGIFLENDVVVIVFKHRECTEVTRTAG